jgi:hypothetical protein
MDVQALLARMAAQRETWATLPDGKRVQLRRPPETELPEMMGGVGLQHVTDCACGWEGFTEADLLGAGIGGSDAVPFHRDLWAAYVADNAQALQAAAAALAECVTQYLTRKGSTAKN